MEKAGEAGSGVSKEEYSRLLAHYPTHLMAIVKLAYHTVLRQQEIMALTWGQVEQKGGFIHLRPEDAKTNEGQSVPLHPEIIETLKGLPRGLPGVRVFTYKGSSVSCLKKSFATACRKAGIEDFTFHDWGHTATTNWRLQGYDYLRIMAASDHQTMSVFKRYTTVSKDELKALVGEKI